MVAFLQHNTYNLGTKYKPNKSVVGGREGEGGLEDTYAQGNWSLWFLLFPTKSLALVVTSIPQFQIYLNSFS